MPLKESEFAIFLLHHHDLFPLSPPWLLKKSISKCLSFKFSKKVDMENPAVSTELEKVSFHPNSKEIECYSILGSAIECSNYRTIALTSLASRFMLKILQARLQSNRTWIKNLQMYKMDLEKSEEPEIKLPIFIES